MMLTARGRRWLFGGVTIFTTGLLLLLFFGARIDTTRFPPAEEFTGVGNCGRTHWTRHRTNLKRSTYICLRTTNHPGEVDVWYARQGYRYENDGWLRERQQSLGVHLTQRERVYHYQAAGVTIIRIYRDAIWRLP